ncbi:short chain dehydrogenase [Caballeronia novacaledonica]|uniref:Short chain dehydrogenase n=1 Tax=Caballeronia novacaledonica TaxID=1544861 RepID=A0A2U3I6J4_9BURK|nr:SDR family oxidoreductase [Caballeronia novacaledonica]SPB15804.1 short chain dehydrogenase [Caballeronia novacaledonica]
MESSLFQDKAVLIVGGSAGLGAATARSFAAQGARVTIASRNAAKLDVCARQIAADVNAQVTTTVLDITDDAFVERYFANAPVYDHVVVTAGETPMGPARSLPLCEAYAAMNSKFWGAYRVARAVQIREGGSLTLVSGFLSVRPRKTSVLQGAINAALEALARGLALELSPVRVNTVSPGLIATSLWSNLDEVARTRMYADAEARLPVRRVGQAEDVTNAILYLASTGYATGSTVLLDGGAALA